MFGITWSAKHAYQFRRAATIVADGYNIAQRALLIFPDRLEYVDEIVCSAAAGENDDAFPGVHCLGELRHVVGRQYGRNDDVEIAIGCRRLGLLLIYGSAWCRQRRGISICVLSDVILSWRRSHKHSCCSCRFERLPNATSPTRRIMVAYSERLSVTNISGECKVY